MKEIDIQPKARVGTRKSGRCSKKIDASSDHFSFVPDVGKGLARGKTKKNVGTVSLVPCVLPKVGGS